MKILLGILLILGAFSTLQFPVVTGMTLCWLMIGYMLAFGIVSIVHFIEARNAEKIAEKQGQAILKTGIGTLILGIASVIVAIISMTSDTGAAAFMNAICTIFGAVIMMDGVSLIVHGIQLKKLAVSGWVGIIVMGALIAVSGVFCIISIFTSLVAISTMFGTAMMLAGVTCIISK